MKFNDLVQYLTVSRSKTVIIERNISKEYPGYVRTVTIMQENTVRVEFDVFGYDEGGITYFVEYKNMEDLIKNLENYLGRKMADWENINQTGAYPEQAEDYPLHVSHEKIKQDLINDKIKIPQNGIKTWMPNGYWKNVHDQKFLRK